MLQRRDMPITIRVGSGSVASKQANISWKVGITNSSSTTIAATATKLITPG